MQIYYKSSASEQIINNSTPIPLRNIIYELALQLKRKEEECEKWKAISKKKGEDLACSNECLLNKMKQLQAEKQKVKELEKKLFDRDKK